MSPISLSEQPDSEFGTLADPPSRTPAFDTSLGVADSDDSDMTLGDDWSVCSSQPFEDEDLAMYGKLLSLPPAYPNISRPSTGPHAGTSHTSLSSASRPRLVRRAPPKAASMPSVPSPRNYNLVRRVTGPNIFALKVAEMETRRQRARDQACRITKNLRVLASVTNRLRQKHRYLCKVVADLSSKENQRCIR